MTTIFVKGGLVYSDTRITTTTYKGDEVIKVSYRDETKVESVDFTANVDGVEYRFINSIGAGRATDINRRILKLTYGFHGFSDDVEPNYSIFFITDTGLVFKDTPQQPLFKVGRYAKAGSGATNPGICCIALFSPRLAVQAASLVDKHTGGRVEQTQSTVTIDAGACGTFAAKYALAGTYLALGAILVTTLPVLLPLGVVVRSFNLLRKRVLK